MNIDTNNIYEQKINDYVIFPRYIARDFREGKVTKQELLVYSYLRISANPYGIVSASIGSISEDLFNGKKSINNTNKILLELKNKRYLYYKKRTGRRGTFDIKFPDFILPSKAISSIKKYFEDEDFRGDNTSSTSPDSEDIHSLDPDNQRSNVIKKQIKQMLKRN